jgi:hypothetical protein
MWHVSDAIQVESSQAHPLLVLPVMQTHHFTLACLAQIAPRVIARAIGQQHIAAHIRALQMKAAQE